MFRGSKILIWACPMRPLLLRESHLSTFPDHTGFGCQRVRCVKARRNEQISRNIRHGSSFSTKTPYFSTQLSSCNLSNESHQRRGVLCENFLFKATLLSYHSHHRVSAKTKQASYLASTFWDSLIKQSFPQHWKRPWDLSQISLRCVMNRQCNFLQSHLHHRHSSLSPVSLLAHKPWILNLFRCKQSPGPPFHQIRTVHQAAPRVADTWRDCLSLENENRCRQSLMSNWKLYDMDKVRKGASHAQDRNRGRWASILVSLCSVEGEPAFLFTLRSSKLKGRHKGDVSFAGGKSDPSDGDVVATALREAREELGIHVLTEKVWGVMKPQRETSGMMIAPVLANLGPLEELTFKPNPEEVEEIFTLSLSHLCNPLNRGYTNFRSGDKFGYTLPVFCNGKHRVWGLTAVALDQTLKLLVPL